MDGFELEVSMLTPVIISFFRCDVLYERLLLFALPWNFHELGWYVAKANL